MKARYLLIALVVVVLLVGGGLAVLSANVDRFRPKIQSELQTKLNRPVSIGHLGLRIFPLSIRVEGFSIGEDPSYRSAQPFAMASKVYVSAGLFSLITGNPKVEDVTLDQPQIELIRNAQGKWNFSTLGGSSSSSGSTKFTLDKLQLNDGRVAINDALHQQPRSVYDHIDLKVTDFAEDKRFDLDLGVHLPGAGKELAEFKGEAGPLSPSVRGAVPPVVGDLSLQEVSLAGVNGFAAGTLPPKTDATLSGSTHVDTSGGKVAAKGDLKMTDTIIRGAKLEYPIEAKYELGADQAFDNIAVKSATVSLGPTTLDVSGSINNAAKPAVLNVEVKTNDSSLTELAKLAGAMGVAFNPEYKIGGKLTLDVIAKGPETAPQLSGNVLLKNVSASGGQIKEPVSTPELDLTLTPGSIMSNTFTAQSGSTSLNAAFTLTNYTSQNPVADVTLKTTNAQIAELLNIAKAYGVAAAEGVNGTGGLSLDVHAHGDTAQPEVLTYAGSASLMNVNLTTPELTKPVLIRSANAQFSQNSVALTNLSAAVGGTSLNGTASAKNFAAPTVAFALAVDNIDTSELENLVAKTPQPATASQPARTKSGLLQSMTGGGTLSVKTIKAQDLVLTAVTTKATLDHGLITLSPLNADAFKGKIAGTLTADMRPATPECSLNAKLSGMDANALMSAVSSLKNELYGTLAATTHLKFAAASSNELARSLNGTVEFALANGELKNVNILREISQVSKILSGGVPASGGTSTPLKQFSGTLNIVNGVATTNNLKAVLDSGSLAANGSLNLVNQGIDMHMLATTSGIALPVLVSGDTAHMHFAPDLQALGKMKVGGLLNGILGGQKSGQKPADTLNSILGAFGKKK
jgi:uncharacterized protein involved in outer membrane biogenesis